MRLMVSFFYFFKKIFLNDLIKILQTGRNVSRNWNSCATKPHTLHKGIFFPKLSTFEITKHRWFEFVRYVNDRLKVRFEDGTLCAISPTFPTSLTKGE